MTTPRVNFYVPSAELVDLGPLPQDFRKWNRILQVIADVSLSIADDIYMAADTHRRDIADSEESQQFLQSCLFYREAFLDGPLTHAELLLRPHLAEFKVIGVKTTTMGEFMTTVRDTVKRLDRAIRLFREGYTKNAWGLKVQIPTRGMRVPSASPNQLLFEFLLKPIGAPTQRQKEFLQQLRGMGRGGIMSIAPRRTFTGQKVEQGLPSMYEVAVINNRLVLGAADVYWGKAKSLYREAKDTTRRMRDYRLANIQEQALRAFRHLRAKEQQAQSQPGSEVVRRRVAIRQMSVDNAHISGNVRVRQAFTPAEWEAALPCYFCQGMMGCEAAVEFSNEDKDVELTKVKWEIRGEYAHSCAELEVQLKAQAL